MCFIASWPVSMQVMFPLPVPAIKKTSYITKWKGTWYEAFCEVNTNRVIYLLRFSVVYCWPALCWAS